MSPKHSPLKVAPDSAVSKSRMNLAAVRPTRRTTPDRILLIGVEGVGKSTFGANAERPIFLSAEDGLAEIEAEAFPEPETFDDVLAAIDELTRTDHPYRTLVVDTLDWIEPLVHAELCRKDRVETIEDVGGGYGKGYAAALDYFRMMLSRLESLQEAKGMEVILLAHSTIANFQNPTGPDYSRYEPKMNKKAASLFKEWAKSVLFATFEQTTVDQKGNAIAGLVTKGRAKGLATGERIVHTTRSAGWDAKNRFALPAVLPLAYETYASARERFRSTGTLEQCRALIASLNLPEEHAARAFVEKNADNSTELVKALARLESLAEKAQ